MSNTENKQKDGDGSDASTCSAVCKVNAELDHPSNLALEGVTEAVPYSVAKSLADEVTRLRLIFPAILEALGNGAGCSVDSSIEFLELIPKEVSLVILKLNVKGELPPCKE